MNILVMVLMLRIMRRGDTIIKNAKKDSAITLSTGNNGINMNDDKAVANVLNTLAGKLTYEAFCKRRKEFEW